MRSVCLVIALGLAIVGWSAPVWAADVHVGINIGIPAPPPFVVPAPPRLAVVPTTPAVHYAPDLQFNFFGYGGRYYTFHNGAWFVAAEYGAPWNYVPVLEVPRPVRVVPARYYRVPPGHCRHHGHDHWRDGDDDGDEEHHHGHGHGHGHGHDDD